MVPDPPRPSDDDARNAATDGPTTTARTSRNPYREILSTPGTLAFSASAVIARLPMSMVGIGTILMIQGIYGSYALAGYVSAVLVVAQATFSPQIARLVDRAGQRRVMLPMLALTTIGLAGLILTAVLKAPQPLLYVFAAIAGATARVVRVDGPGPLDVRPRRRPQAPHRLLAGVGARRAGLRRRARAGDPARDRRLPLGRAARPPRRCSSRGGLWFLSLRSTEPPVVVSAPGVKNRSAMRTPGMVLLAMIFVAMGIIFGATDVSTIAFAEEQGSKGVAGFILAVFAMGSLISGLVYGARHWVSPLWKRFVIGMIALAAGSACSCS